MIPRAAAAALLAAAVLVPARAGAVVWKGELFDFEAGHAYVGFRLLDLAIYEPVTGLGIGTNPFEVKRKGWDVRRPGRPDASGHNVITVAPVNLYAIVYSREGEPAMFSDYWGSLTLQRVELFASYSNWSSLGDFTEVGTDILGERTRVPVEGSVPARMINTGVRWDYGKYAAASVGRLELKTRRSGPFLERYSAQWYVAGQMYFGATFGSKDDFAGGGLYYLVRSGWAGLKHLFRCRGWRCTVEEDP